MSRIGKYGWQQGNALIVTLLLLVGMTMITVTSFNIGVSDLRIAGNMQHREEAAAAARKAIEQAISSARIKDHPEDVYHATSDDYQTICANANALNTYCVDVNDDDVSDITVVLDPQPACVVGRVLRNSELDLSEDEDLGCVVGVQQTHGVAGTITGDSLCGQITWELRAVATDAVVQSQVAMTEGVGIRSAMTDIETYCPVSGAGEGGGEEDGGDGEG